tara:strand:+ start:749 stop:1588 length:840 start_codon:yes stop_codon:yes gene_type:complete
MNVITIPLDQLQRGRYQPRSNISPEHVTDIVLSLREIGQQEPITVTVNKNDPDRYDIVSGEYRWHAAKELNWENLKAVVLTSPDKMIAVSAIISNNSLPLNPIEIAQSYARLIDEFGLKHIEVARSCGVGNSRYVVVHALRLLKLPKVVRNLIASGKITPSHGLLLLKAPSDKIVDLALKVSKMQWSTRQLQFELAALSEPVGMNKGLDFTRTDDWIELEDALSSVIGSAVSIEKTGHKTKPKFKVQIKCETADELNDLLTKIQQMSTNPLPSLGSTTS